MTILKIINALNILGNLRRKKIVISTSHKESATISNIAIRPPNFVYYPVNDVIICLGVIHTYDVHFCGGLGVGVRQKEMLSDVMSLTVAYPSLCLRMTERFGANHFFSIISINFFQKANISF